MIRIIILLCCLFIGSTFAEPVVISSSDPGVIENEEELLAKVFGSKKREQKKNIIMEFSLLLDGESIGEVMVMVGPINKVFIKSIKDALADYLLDEEIKKIDSLKNENGFIAFDDLNFLNLETKLNTTTLQLEINVPINKKKTRSLGKRAKNSREKPNVSPATLSGFINTRFANTTYRGTNNSNNNAFILTPAINLYGMVLEGECSYYKNSTNNKGKCHRDYTTFVYDYPAKAMTFRLGDIFSHSIDYQSVPRVMGLELKRNALQESTSDNYSENVQLTLLRKSTIEIYINDTLVKTKTDIAPGTYTLDDIPYTYGSNNIKIKIIDDTGREQYLNSRMFIDNSFVQKGDASWGMTLGYPEINNEKERYDKSKPVTSAFIKYGIMNATELLLGIQHNKIGNAITSGIRNKNIFGLTEFKYAYSRYKEKTVSINGKVFFVSYTTPSIDVSFAKLSWGVSAERADTFFYPYLDNLANFQKDSNESFLTQRQNIKGKNSHIRYHMFISDFLGLNFSVNYNIKNRANVNREKSFSTNVSKHISLNSKVFSYAYINCEFERTKDFENKKNRRLSINCSISLKNNTTFSARFENARENSYLFSMSHSPQNNGFGYNLSKSKTNNHDSYGASADYSNSRFKTNINYNKASHSINTTQVGLETGIFFADGAFAIGRNKINDGGFVIVRPKSALANQDVKFLNNCAESGILGGAVLSTSKNNINSARLDLSDLPDNMEVKNDTITYYGYYKRGALTDISSEGNFIAKGMLLDESGIPLNLIGGTIISLTNHNEEPIQFFTNSEGKFVISNLKPGKYRVIVNVKCCEDFEIEIKDSQKQIIDLGTITCRDCNEND